MNHRTFTKRLHEPTRVVAILQGGAISHAYASDGAIEFAVINRDTPQAGLADVDQRIGEATDSLEKVY